MARIGRKAMTLLLRGIYWAGDLQRVVGVPPFVDGAAHGDAYVLSRRNCAMLRGEVYIHSLGLLRCVVATLRYLSILLPQPQPQLQTDKPAQQH